MKPHLQPLLFVCLAFCSLKAVAQHTMADTARAQALLLKGDSLALNYHFAEALEIFEEAKQIYLRLGLKNETLALCWQGTGELYYYLRDFDRAIEDYQTALTIYREILGDDHPRVYTCYNNLGIFYNSKGDYAASSEYYKKSLEKKLLINDPCGTDLATSYQNISTNLLHLGKPEEALGYLEQALGHRINCNGPEGVLVGNIYSNFGSAYGSMGNSHKQAEYLEKAKSVLERAGEERNPHLINCYSNLGLAYDEIGFFEKALIYHEKALALRQKHWSHDPYGIAVSLTNIGSHFQKLGDFPKSIEFTERALELLVKNGWGEHPVTSNLYNNLGVAYASIGDAEKGVEYHRKAIELRVKNGGKEGPGVAESYQNIATYYTAIGDNEQAISYYERAIQSIQSRQKEDHPHIAQIFDNIGFTYFNMGKYQEALSFYEKALDIRKRVLGEDHWVISASLHNMGNPLLWDGDTGRAIELVKEAISISQKHFGERHPGFAGNYTLLGNNYMLGKNYPLAEEAHLKALQALNYAPGASPGQINSIPQLLLSLNEIGRFYQHRYREEGRMEDLERSGQYFQEAFQALDYQSRRVSPGSRSLLAEQASRIFGGAVSTGYLHFRATGNMRHLEECFDFAERSKGILLYEALQESRALQIAGIPDSLLRQEYDLRIAIANLEKQRQEAMEKGIAESDSALLVLGNRLFEKNRLDEGLKLQFLEKYPQYHKARYDLSAVSANYVNDTLLLPGQSLVEYLVGDSAVYIFLLQKGHFEVQEVKLDFPLEKWVTDMTKEGIYGYYTLPAGRRTAMREAETIRNYTRSARQLYEKLLLPVEGRLTERVILIPDGVLGYVPFEALLTAQPPREGAFDAYSFVLDKHQISYCYSATLLREMRDKRRSQTAARDLLAMAPFYRGDAMAMAAWADTSGWLLALRDSLGALPSSGEEVAAISKNWKRGIAFYGTDASVEKFRELASRCRIIHLSTHGRADDRLGDYAYLAFSRPGEPDAFDKLYARDLYNLSLNADMVVLSACESGIGKLRKGEGIVSLARAFAYAGASSIFTTLWKVSDESTKELCIRFYRHLKAGKPKDEALRQAKLDYLKQNKGKGEASHPFFWAGMIGIGDMRNE
ncbi:MAG: tetratricopeptide repeat protein [Saprospiraceae bacterium]